MTIAKSPVSPVVTFPYYITKFGIKLLHVSETKESGEDEMGGQDPENLSNYFVEVNPWNYWNQTIYHKPPTRDMIMKAQQTIIN